MTATKLVSYSDLQKEIKVTDWAASLPTGLQITFNYQDKEYNLIANEAQSCELLKYLGAIADYIQHDDWVEVGAYMYDDAGYESIRWMGYGAFAAHLYLEYDDAVKLAAIHMDMSMTQKWVMQMKQIPSLIEKIGA